MKYFTKKWYMLENDLTEDIQEYLSYKKNFLPQWYNEFSIHDDQIKNVTQINGCFIIDLNADDYEHTRYELKFYNPNIIESCELKNAWCISDELYITDNWCEYHLMVMDYYDNDIVEYLTIKCSNMELFINNKSFKVFNNTEFGSIYRD